MRHTSIIGISLIKRFEGLSLSTYQCPAGINTIGYGHIIKPHEQFSIITEQQAEELLVQDLVKAEQAVSRNISVSLTECQFDALVSFTFNVGGGALQRSTLRQKVNSDEHDTVPAEFMRWVWAGGKKLPGLIKRRQLEGEVYQLY
jgi:lysozyme